MVSNDVLGAAHGESDARPAVAVAVHHRHGAQQLAVQAQRGAARAQTNPGILLCDAAREPNFFVLKHVTDFQK